MNTSLRVPIFPSVGVCCKVLASLAAALIEFCPNMNPYFSVADPLLVIPKEREETCTVPGLENETDGDSAPVLNDCMLDLETPYPFWTHALK